MKYTDLQTLFKTESCGYHPLRAFRFLPIQQEHLSHLQPGKSNEREVKILWTVATPARNMCLAKVLAASYSPSLLEAEHENTPFFPLVPST